MWASRRLKGELALDNRIQTGGGATRTIQSVDIAKDADQRF